MNDTPNDTPNDSTNKTSKDMTLDEMEAMYKAKLDEAQKVFMAALGNYLEAVQQHHGFTQRRSGFSAGWDASRSYFKDIFESQMRANASVAGLAALSANNMDMNLLTSSPPSPPTFVPTANDLVHQFVTENPGKRGVEIADNFAKTVWRLPERTVRTALHRLKTAEPPKIKIVDGRWYAAEAAPADPQLAMED